MNSIPEIPGVGSTEVPLCRRPWWIKYRDKIVLVCTLCIGAVISGVVLMVAWQLRYILLGLGVLVGVLACKEERTLKGWVEAILLGIVAGVVLPILESLFSLFSGFIGFLTCVVGAFAIVLGSQARGGKKP